MIIQLIESQSNWREIFRLTTDLLTSSGYRHLKVGWRKSLFHLISQTLRDTWSKHGEQLLFDRSKNAAIVQNKTRKRKVFTHPNIKRQLFMWLQQII